MCPAGYHKVGDCVDRAGQYICKKCGNAEYTEVPNLIPKCQRCDSCSHIEKEIKPCTFNSNVVCDCKDGYYNSNPNPHIRNCQTCNLQDVECLLIMRTTKGSASPAKNKN
ncbi:tumor necrosis factor receptor superfamily member 1A-like [Micropterus salmoides]|uniref:tumor necrosis factor receptor superfamily member 1A-like n=1 Tax=Micropterus salmoides TaxID=27706 RepID=UPI0018EA5632|nr:tumor necrosis factor receptor superfamily member 1A-like [Micropterus salmoides]